MGDDLWGSAFVKYVYIYVCVYLMENLNTSSGELILIYTRKLNYERKARLNNEA